MVCLLKDRIPGPEMYLNKSVLFQSKKGKLESAYTIYYIMIYFLQLEHIYIWELTIITVFLYWPTSSSSRAGAS